MASASILCVRQPESFSLGGIDSGWCMDEAAIKIFPAPVDRNLQPCVGGNLG